METIKLHPTASPIVVVTPENKEAFAKAVATINEAVEAIRKVFKALAKAVIGTFKVMRRLVAFPVSVRLHPTANVIQIPFYKAVELGYYRTWERELQ